MNEIQHLQTQNINLLRLMIHSSNLNTSLIFCWETRKSTPIISIRSQSNKYLQLVKVTVESGNLL